MDEDRDQPADERSLDLVTAAIPHNPPCCGVESESDQEREDPAAVHQELERLVLEKGKPNWKRHLHRTVDRKDPAECAPPDAHRVCRKDAQAVPPEPEAHVRAHG